MRTLEIFTGAGAWEIPQSWNSRTMDFVSYFTTRQRTDASKRKKSSNVNLKAVNGDFNSFIGCSMRHL